jgi:hypothetical protein
LTRSYTPIKCLNADQTLPTHPDYYVAGLLDGSGSCTLLANTNNTDLDTLLALSDFTFYIGTANLKFNGIIVNSAATDIVGAGDQTVVSLDIVTLGSTAGVVVS